jgi:hypothetical protein
MIEGATESLDRMIARFLKKTFPVVAAIQKGERVTSAKVERNKFRMQART